MEDEGQNAKQALVERMAKMTKDAASAKKRQQELEEECRQLTEALD